MEESSTANDIELGDSPMPNDNELEAACSEVDSANLTLEQMESRLAIGEILKDEATAYVLYCKYASLKGFNVRIGRNVRSKDGTYIIGKFFFCSCEGFSDNKSSKDRVPDYQKTSFRCGCQAKLRIGRKRGDVWRVTRFDKEHNHDLYATDETYLLKSTRKVSDDPGVMLSTMVKSKVPIRKALMDNLPTGVDNAGAIPNDISDCLDPGKRKAYFPNADCIELVQHLVTKSNKESNFYWNVEADADKHLMNFFMRDNRCRIDYELFGDVVSFDTTFRTNKYGLVCAPFVGVNHHNERVMFGLAFLSDEKEDSFKWLFRAFIESMNDKQPNVIFTNQCEALVDAVQAVFPCAQHRLCQWHVNETGPSHFGGLYRDPAFKNLWEKCMNECESEGEFEAAWKEMTGNYVISDQKWISLMYDLRHKWATAFNVNIFSAGLLAPSRSARTKMGLRKRIGNETSSLLDCVIDYEQVQDKWRLNEKEKDTLCHHNRPAVLVEHNPLLQHAAKVYTFSIFSLFQKELIDTIGVQFKEQFTPLGSSLMVFRVKSRSAESRIRTVEYDGKKLEVNCSCHKFETAGILCKHALKVFDFVNQEFIPERYILKRWTKSARERLEDKNKSERSGNWNDSSSSVLEMQYVNHIMQKVHEFAMRSKSYEATRAILTKCLETAKERLDAWFQKMSLNDVAARDDNLAAEPVDNLANEVFLCDPVLVNSGVIDAQTNHSDDKSKKRNGGAESSVRVAKATKWTGQISQCVVNELPTQEATNVLPSQEATGFQSSQTVHPASLTSQPRTNPSWFSLF